MLMIERHPWAWEGTGSATDGWHGRDVAGWRRASGWASEKDIAALLPHQSRGKGEGPAPDRSGEADGRTKMDRLAVARGRREDGPEKGRCDRDRTHCDLIGCWRAVAAPVRPGIGAGAVLFQG